MKADAQPSPRLLWLGGSNGEPRTRIVRVAVYGFEWRGEVTDFSGRWGVYQSELVAWCCRCLEVLQDALREVSR